MEDMRWSARFIEWVCEDLCGSFFDRCESLRAPLGFICLLSGFLLFMIFCGVASPLLLLAILNELRWVGR